jgi:anti-sigma B factor antagonist
MTWLKRYKLRFYIRNSSWHFPLLSMVAVLGLVRFLHWIEGEMSWELGVTPCCGGGGASSPGCREGELTMSEEIKSRTGRLEVEDVGGATVACLTDRKILDEQNIQILGKQLFGLVDQLGKKNLVLNFTNVEYMSSAALGMLIRLRKKVQEAGGKLVLCAIDPQIYEVFVITKLDKAFVVRRDEQEALRHFSIRASAWRTSTRSSVNDREGCGRTHKRERVLREVVWVTSHV